MQNFTLFLNFIIYSISFSFICAADFYNTTTSELDTIYFNNFEDDNGGLYDTDFDFVVDDPDSDSFGIGTIVSI